MAETSGTVRLQTQHGTLVLDREILRGPDGCLYEASDVSAAADHAAARVFVFIPSGHAQQAYLERLRHIDRLARYGWLTPDSVEHDPRYGVTAVFRLDRGRLLDGVPDADLGGLGDRARTIGRLCHAVARGHDAEIYHGHIGPMTVVLDGQTPMLLDAPVGTSTPAGVRPPGRAAADIRALGELLRSLTEGVPCARAQRARLATIVAKASAEEASRRYPQVVRMGDELLAMAARPAASSRGRFVLASTAAAVVLAGTAWAAFRAGETRSSDKLDNAAGLLAAMDFEIRDRETRIQQLEEKFSTQRRLVSTTQDFFWFAEQRVGVTPYSTVAFNAIELLGWPELFTRSGADDRTILADRLLLAREFVRAGYQRADGLHLDVIMTELMVAVWELQAGEVGNAVATLERVIPNLESRCIASDPLLRGAMQLLEYTRDRAAGREASLAPGAEAWVVRLINNLGGDPRPIDAPGSKLDSTRLRFYDAVSLERDMDFTASVLMRKGIDGVLLTPGS